MKDTIVFCLRVHNEESYSAASDFIYRREHQINLTETQIQGVLYKYYLKNEIRTNNKWMDYIVKDEPLFANIKEPHKVKDITQRFEVLYCLSVDRQADIIDLSNLYLLKHHYSDLNMIIWFPECDDTRYFSVSQFLYSVYASDQEFYNACYFSYRGKLQRAQINNITFSRSFTPLQIIDEKNVKRLFRKCRGLIKKHSDHLVFLEDEVGSEKYDDLLRGAVKILSQEEKRFSMSLKDRYYAVLEKLDILAFVLLCYVIFGEKAELALPLLERYAVQMQQYSNAIRQLAENIVFHSKTGTGVIACRMHNRKSCYIQEKYHKEDVDIPFLEIIVSDFCRDNTSCNISDNFKSHLEDRETRVAFANLQPRTFFAHDKDVSIQRAWEEFYRNPDHIGRHFGLRIFQSVVSAYDGIFGAESHCGYSNMPGDSFRTYEAEEPSVCMPGTRYRIVFPIENIQKVTKQDLSLDSGINLGVRIRDYFNYTAGELAVGNDWEIPQTQQKKNEQIRHLSDYIQQEMDKRQGDIIYISMLDMQDNMGEIIAKALTIALYHMKRDRVVVLYQCMDNLKKNIFDTMRIFFLDTEIEAMFSGRKVQIVLFSEDFEETVLDLSSIHNTDSIQSYISHIKCTIPKNGCLDNNAVSTDLRKGATEYIPCDVLGEVKIGEKTQTLFEHYTERILRKSIQGSEFGCRLEHTHMRLGSTIHIDNFYEAEILFGNKLFISRFAFLLVRDMQNEIKNIPKITLYGYGTYSEAVLVQMIEMLRALYQEKKDVDYIILEREEERRGFLHKDRIRYNRYFQSDDERIAYFQDRKIAIVVLINSTLKTHLRLINLFKEENGDIADYQWIIRNYAVILVGNAQKNKYWGLKNDKFIELRSRKILPVPRYFLQVDADYQEPSDCKQCFPNNPVAEVPLIEVNAASTIPNQAFGIVDDGLKDKYVLKYDMIKKEENKLKFLKGEFIYGHVQRNENHFVYYFRTENIYTRWKEEIRESLRKWKGKYWDGGVSQYNVIVAPMHFSNAGFVELVNNVIFDGNAILLRVDFDKEYRCNAYTKYSYLRNYVEQLNAMDFEGTVHVHFVDDSIISGRTYQRARSLIRSVFSISDCEQDSVSVKVFDRVFVLVDRNSDESRRQYVKDNESDFYAFVTVKISSLRNYGDSCVYCNLKKEADLLYDIASTKPIADYWKHCAEKFKLYSLEQYNDRYQRIDYEKQFRRLFCTHMAQCVLVESRHGNNNEEVLYLILELLNVDYEFRKKDRYEYFLSYLKCISRPFLVFHKPIREAIFDIMLILIDSIVYNKKIRKVIKEIELEKPYLSERRLIIQFNKLDGNIIRNQQLSGEDRKNLVRLLMKQLTELKSNYIIRPEKMESIFHFMECGNKKDFERDYITWIDRLVGASSDTNKSVWLDKSIAESKFVLVPEDFRNWILIENTRAFKDGIEKLYKRIYEKDSASIEFGKIADARIRELERQYDCKRSLKMFDDFEKKYEPELKKYDVNETDSEIVHHMNTRIKRFLKSLPELEKVSFSGVINSMKQSSNDWSEIFRAVKELVKEECGEWNSDEEAGGIQAKLLQRIEVESDMYQFGSFYKLLQEEQEGYIDGHQLLPEGADMLVCCVKILSLCRSKEPALLEKVQLLAMLFKVVLHAQRVQFIIENRAGSNLDAWKHNIEKKYNAIVDRVCGLHSGKEIETVSIKGKKHYTIIVEKTGGGDYNTDVSETTEQLIEQLENQADKGPNYIMDVEHGAVVWKLENDQRSIWINMENDEWHHEEPGFKVKIARRIRKVLMFYQELRNGVFNPENDDYINEISHVRKELSIYNSDKVYTHTKDHSIEAFFEHAKHYFVNEEQEKYISDYPSYVLKLITDLNISQYYRYGLRGTLYFDERGFNKTAVWSDFVGLIKDGREYTYCVSKNENIKIQLRVAEINDNEEMLCRTSSSSIREITMLIYALILNAAEQNRGKRKNPEKSARQSGQKSVIVDIYSEEGDLVIENECEYKVDLQQIKRKLHYVPDSEEDGISLWSLNCYIRQCINSMILAKLKEIERNLEENLINISDIKDTGAWITRLTGSEYEIRPDSEEREGKCYFRVKIPIFMKKFRQAEKGEK